MSSLLPMDADALVFQSALSMWDRPERELGGKPLSAEDDVDAFIDDAFKAVVE